MYAGSRESYGSVMAGRIYCLTTGCLDGKLKPTLIACGFFFLSMLLTQPMSNQAAALVVLPVAIQTVIQMNLNPRTFAMMIAVGALPLPILHPWNQPV
jgi:di/tricarboxylate transporter